MTRGVSIPLRHSWEVPSSQSSGARVFISEHTAKFLLLLLQYDLEPIFQSPGVSLRISCQCIVRYFAGEQRICWRIGWSIISYFDIWDIWNYFLFFFFLQREWLITKALWKKDNILIKNVPKVGIKIQGLLYFILDSMWPQLTSHVVSIGKEYACKAGDTREAVSIPGSGRFHGGGNGNPLQYSCPEKLKDRGAWQTTVHEVTKSQAWLSN